MMTRLTHSNGPHEYDLCESWPRPLLRAGEKRVHSRSVSFAQGVGAQDVHRVCFDVLDVGLPSSLP